MSIDFLLTYPCYSPLRSRSEPWTATSAGSVKEVAVAIITDDDLNREFLLFNKMGEDSLRMVFEDAQGLAEYLSDQLHATVNGTPITHVLIDPGDPSRRARNYPIPEFVEHILAGA